MTKNVTVSTSWIGLLSVLMSAFIVGGFTFAWNVNAQQAKTEVLLEANLPERMTKIEVKLENMRNDLDRVQTTSDRIESKIDNIVIRGDKHENNKLDH